jgi:hypothetical protein
MAKNRIPVDPTPLRLASAREFNRECRSCGKPFTTKSTAMVYCSGDCMRSPTRREDLYLITSSATKFRVLERDGFKCAYCGASAAEDGVKLHVDHIRSLKQHGEDTLANVITACDRCNLSKGARLLGPLDEEWLLGIVEKRNQEKGIDGSTVIRTSSLTLQKRAQHG